MPPTNHVTATGVTRKGLVRRECCRRLIGVVAASGWGKAGFASVVEIQIPENTASRPTTRLSVIGSPTRTAASVAAAMGFTVMVLATRGTGVLQRHHPQNESQRASAGVMAR